MTAEMGHEERDWKLGEQETEGGGGGGVEGQGERESVGFEYFAHNVKLLITALEHQHGESGPADCDLGSTALCSERSRQKTKMPGTFLFSGPVRVSIQ